MRTAIKETVVYSFDELPEEAQENARAWWRDVFEFDHELVTDQAKFVARILGINIDEVYFSGFWSQGDGACFTGTYEYNKRAAKDIREFMPNNTTLHEFADRLQEVQRRAFYGLYATMRHRGRYYHSGCMSVSLEDKHDGYKDVSKFEDEVTQIMRDFADWIYKELEEEYEFLMSDEQVDESIRLNGYEFTADGRIY